MVELRARAAEESGPWPIASMLVFAGIVTLLFFLSNPFQFEIKGIVPGAAALVDPNTSQAIYANGALQNLVRAAVFCGWAIPVVLNAPIARRVVVRAPLLCMFMIYVVCSSRWSDTPAATIVDVIYLATAMMAGVALAVLLNPQDAARAFAWGGAMIALASLAAVFLLPLYGIHQASEGSQGGHAGDWRGVYTHKNTLGPIMAVFAIIFAANGRRLFGSLLLHIGFTALALLMVLASRSVSAFVVLGVCFGGYIFLFVIRGVIQIVAAILLPLLAIGMAGLSGQMLQAFGRGSDLSGRTDIWAAAYRMFLNRPIFGYGYGSSTMGGLTAYLTVRLKAVHTHNGYIDLALMGGVVGSTLLYAAIAWALYRAAKAWRRDGQDGLLVETLGIFVLGWLVAAFTEVALRPNEPMGALGIAAVVVLSSLPAAPPAGTTRHATLVAGAQRSRV